MGDSKKGMLAQAKERKTEIESLGGRAVRLGTQCSNVAMGIR